MLKTVTVRVSLLAITALTSLSAHAIADSARQVDIPSGDLPTALWQLAHETGADLVYRPEQVRGLKTHGAHGSLTTAQAVTELLEGTNLGVIVSKAGSVLIAEPNSTAAASLSSNGTATGDGDKGNSKEGTEGKSFWDRFRLAQAHQGSSAPSSAVMQGRDEQAPQNGNVELEQVVVTAQKREERLQDVPISVSVLGGAELDRNTFLGTSEALGTIPGVATTESFLGGGTQVAVRGVTASAALFSGSSPIAYYVDSMPFGLVRSAIAPDQRTYDLERVEVLRGPQGTLYGASALNGVVRVITHDVDLNEFDFKARTTGSAVDGGNGNYRGDFALNVPIVDGKLGARAVVGYENDSGWIDSPRAKNINDAQLRNARIKVDAKPTQELSIGLFAWHTDDDYGASPSSLANGTITATSSQPISTRSDTYGLKVGYDFQAVSLSSTSSYLDYKNSSWLDLSPTGAGGNGLTLGSQLNSKVVSEELLANSNLAGPWRWSAGLFFRDGEDKTSQEVNTIASGMPLDNESFSDFSTSYAVYGELSRRFLHDVLEWTLGLRYFHDHVGTQANDEPLGFPAVSLSRINSDFHATTPRAVLTWRPMGEGINLYVSYSQGFRSGFPQDELVTGVAPNFPSVAPDKLKNFEVGAKGDLWDRKLSFDAAVYSIKWQGVQQTLGVPTGFGTNVVATVNGSSASGVGTDFALTARPVRGLRIGVNLSWNGLTQDESVYSGGSLLFDKGQRMNFSPQYTLGSQVDYSFGLGAGGLEGRIAAAANYTSEQDNTALVGNSRQVLKGDAITIARLSAGVEGNRWSLMAFVDNLSNERGAPIRSASTPEWDVRIRPRTIGLQLEYRTH